MIHIEYKYQQNLAKDEYESNFVTAVVAPGIGVKFNDVGALEEVKKALNELVILPMRRPELLSWKFVAGTHFTPNMNNHFLLFFKE